jgi:uncharacterized protein (DUF697 family)
VGVLKLARRGLKLARGTAFTAFLHASASHDGRVALVPGDPAVTAWLRRLLDVPLQERPDLDALAVVAVPEDADVASVAAALAERAEAGGQSLAVILGSPERRAATERALRAVPGIELSSIVHVARPDADGERRVLDGLIRRLGDQAVGAARENAALRPAIGAHLVSQTAASACVLASGTAGRRARMHALTTIQLTMLGTLQGAYGRPLNARLAGDALAIVGSGFAWRLLGRRATTVPVPSVMLRGGVAYMGTRVLGELILRRLAADKDLTDLRPATIKETLARLRSGVSAPTTKGEAA